MPPIGPSTVTPRTPPEPDYEGTLWECVYDHAAVHGEDSLYQVDVIPPHYVIRVATSDRSWTRIAVMEMRHEELEDLVEDGRFEFYGRSRLGWEVRLADTEIDLGDPPRTRAEIPSRTRQDAPSRQEAIRREVTATGTAQRVPETPASRARASAKAEAAARAEERARSKPRAADTVEMPVDEPGHLDPPRNTLERPAAPATPSGRGASRRPGAGSRSAPADEAKASRRPPRD